MEPPRTPLEYGIAAVVVITIAVAFAWVHVVDARAEEAKALTAMAHDQAVAAHDQLEATYAATRPCVLDSAQVARVLAPFIPAAE